MKVKEEYTLPNLDINYAAFQEMKLNQKWLNENLGYYVAFVDGELVGKHRDRKKLLAELRQKFPKKAKFFIKVELDERIVDISSPLSINGI